MFGVAILYGNNFQSREFLAAFEPAPAHARVLAGPCRSFPVRGEGSFAALSRFAARRVLDFFAADLFARGLYHRFWGHHQNEVAGIAARWIGRGGDGGLLRIDGIWDFQRMRGARANAPFGKHQLRQTRAFSHPDAARMRGVVGGLSWHREPGDPDLPWVGDERFLCAGIACPACFAAAGVAFVRSDAFAGGDGADRSRFATIHSTDVARGFIFDADVLQPAFRSGASWLASEREPAGVHHHEHPAARDVARLV